MHPTNLKRGRESPILKRSCMISDQASGVFKLNIEWNEITGDRELGMSLDSVCVCVFVSWCVRVCVSVCACVSECVCVSLFMSKRKRESECVCEWDREREREREREWVRERESYAVRKICQGKLDWVKYDYVTKMTTQARHETLMETPGKNWNWIFLNVAQICHDKPK